jgi:Holliday junction resolvasome RuvABC endonuclease subunit
MKRNPHTILAIDPGTRTLGLAVLARGELAAYGVRSFDRLAAVDRPRAVRNLVDEWIVTHHPSTLVLEHTHPHPIPQFDAIHRLSMGLARRTRRMGLHVAVHHVLSVRQLVAGDGRATKRELAAAVLLYFPVLRPYRVRDRRWRELYFSNLFDAVALALYHDVRYR